MDERPNIAPQARPRQAGFTLVELVIVILIVGVLVAAALPSMTEMAMNEKIKSAANELYFDLSYARAEAIKRNATVQVVRTGSNWTQGWTVQAPGNLVLRTQSATKGINAGGANDAAVSFNPDGRTTLAVGTANSFMLFDPGSVSVPTGFTAGTRLVSMRCVALTASGRPAVRIDRNRDGDCDD